MSSAILLIALVLVPLTARVHQYSHPQDHSGTCATCVVAFHATATSTIATPAIVTPVPLATAFASAPADVAPIAVTALPPGRAPPVRPARVA
jgi:hypothetical protein